jgi:hypothetical protein
MKEYAKIAIVALVVIIVYDKFLSKMLKGHFEGDNADDADELDDFDDFE